MKGVVVVKSREHWFRRCFPDYPLGCVHFTDSPSVDHDALNPYESSTIVLCRPDGPTRWVIVGLVAYGSSELIDSPAPVPVPPGDIPLVSSLSMDVIKEYLSQENPGPNPSIEWLLALMTGERPAHPIPYSFFEWANVPISYEKVGSVQLQDLQNHYPRPQPAEWFVVPLEDTPNALANTLPLWQGAVLHVSSDDIWEVLRPKRPVSHLAPQLEHLAGFLADLRRRRSEGASPEKIRSKEVVLEKAPPCIRRILDQGKFPVDTPRQMLVRTLKHVRLEVIGELLDERNSSSTPTIRRWDYKAHHKSGYPPPSCEKMDSCGLCPLEKGRPIDAKKTACYKLFTERFPEKHPSTRTFNGPIKWYEW